MINIKEYLTQHYINQNKSISKIAKENGMSTFQVRKLLDDNNFEIISSSERITKNINASLFNSQSPTSVFLLGYIMMDGDLQYNQKTKKYFLRLYSKYRNQIELVQELLEMEGKLQYRKETFHNGKKQGAIYFIHIPNQNIIQKLMSYGMVSNKNDKILLPEIKNDLIPYFLRGCFMGSGSFYMNKNGKIHISFTIGSKSFINSLNHVLYNQGLTFRKIYKNKTKSPSYYFRYAEQDSLKLINFIYNSDYEVLRCQRQVEKIHEYYQLELNRSKERT